MKKGTLITLSAVTALLTFNVAFAVSGTGIGQTIRQEVQEKKQEVKTVVAAVRHAKAVAKCDIATAKLEKRIKNFDHQKTQHLASYNKTKEKFQALITKLEGQGKDVTKLKQDLVVFGEKITQFETDYAAYTTLLSQTKNYSCENSEVDFKAKLKEARDQLKVVHQDAVAIRTFYAKTIRPDILALKEKTAETETTTNEQED